MSWGELMDYEWAETRGRSTAEAFVVDADDYIDDEF